MTLYPTDDPMMSVMNSAPDTMIYTPQHNMAMGMDWTAIFSAGDLGNFENIANVSYASPPTRMTHNWASDDGLSGAVYGGEYFLSQSNNSVSEYLSFDCHQPGMGNSLALGARSGLTAHTTDSARERRKTQNRSAQRAYRLRKEQVIKDQEIEIETLKSQISEQKRLNQTLARSVEVLKGQITSKYPKSGPRATTLSESKLGTNTSQRRAQWR